MTPSTLRPRPTKPATEIEGADASRPRRAVPPGKLAKRPVAPAARQRTWAGWNGTVSRADREHAQERLAVLALSSVLVVAVLLLGGALYWDKIYLGQRPIVRVDGQTTTLRQYADQLAYKRNLLTAQLDQAQQLAASQPPSGSGADSSQNFLAQYAAQQVQLLSNRLSGLSTQLAEDIVDDQIIRDEAAKRNVTASPDEIDAELKQMIGYQDPNATPVPTVAAAAQPAVSPDQAAEPTTAPTPAPTVASGTRKAQSFASLYRDYQRATAGTDAIIRHDVESQILRRKLGDLLGQSVPTAAEQVHARHILVADESAANAVEERLKNGESFEALAAELSTDTSNKDNGGDLGWFPRGVMVSEFEAGAFKLQPGEISAPVKTSFGYHVIRVDERDSNRPLDPQQLDQQKSGALAKWLDGEKKNHRIERFVDADRIDWAEHNGREPKLPSRAA